MSYRPLTANTSEDINRIVAKKSHFNKQTEAFINSQDGEVELVLIGCSSKLFKLVTGKDDLYPQLASTHEQDKATAQALFEAVGRKVRQQDPSSMVYWKKKS